MSGGPAHVGDVGKWRLLRWEYDGAPLMAEHPGMRADRAAGSEWFTVEIDMLGDLVFNGLKDGVSPCVPVEVLRELIDDAIARGVWDR